MLTAILAVILSVPVPLTDAQADALLEVYLATDTPLPATLPGELRPALARFWAREQLWNPAYPISNLASEISWTRSNWPNEPLPDLVDVERLPTEAEIARDQNLIAWMRCDLDRLADMVPEWNAPAIAIQRGEIDAHACFLAAASAARRGDNFVGRRRSLDEVRRLIGDEAYYAGAWPTVPWWRWQKK